MKTKFLLVSSSFLQELVRVKPGFRFISLEAIDKKARMVVDREKFKLIRACV